MNVESYTFEQGSLPLRKQLPYEHVLDRRETVASITARIDRLMNDEGAQEEERVVLPVLRSQKRPPVRGVRRSQPERVSYRDTTTDSSAVCSCCLCG